MKDAVVQILDDDGNAVPRWGGGQRIAMAHACPSCKAPDGIRCHVPAGPLKGQPYPEIHVSRWMLHYDDWWCDECWRIRALCHRARPAPPPRVKP